MALYKYCIIIIIIIPYSVAETRGQRRSHGEDWGGQNHLTFARGIDADPMSFFLIAGMPGVGLDPLGAPSPDPLKVLGCSSPQ